MSADDNVEYVQASDDGEGCPGTIVTGGSDGDTPTRRELWQALQSQMVENRALTCQALNVVQQNTQAMTEMHATLKQLQEVIETLVGTMTKVVVDKVSGVPTKTFALVVFVLLAIIVSLLGLDISGLFPLH